MCSSVTTEDPIRFILTLESVRANFGEESFVKMLEQTKISLSDYERRIKGKNKELEFVLGIHMLEKCTNIVLLDESYSSVFGIRTGDVLVSLKNGKKYMIEIKCPTKETEDDKPVWSDTGSHIRKQKQCAEELGFELYYAICYCDKYWALYSSDYVLNNKSKIFVRDIENSVLEDLFEIREFVFDKYVFKSVFTKKDKNSIKGFGYGDYPNLVSEELVIGGQRKYKIKKNDSKMLAVSFCLEGLRDKAIKRKEEKLDDDKLLVTETIDGVTCSEFELLISPIKHTIDSSKRLINAKQYMDDLKANGGEVCFTVTKLRSVIKGLPKTPVSKR